MKTHISYILEAERDDLENVNDVKEEDHSKKEDNLEKEENFNNDLENEKSDLSKWLSKQKPSNEWRNEIKRTLFTGSSHPNISFWASFDHEIVNFMMNMTNLCTQSDTGKHRMLTKYVSFNV